jgi:hypothetical protein
LLDLYLLTLPEWNPHRIQGLLWDTTFYVRNHGIELFPPRPDDTVIRNTGTIKKILKGVPAEEPSSASLLCLNPESDLETAEVCYRRLIDTNGRESFKVLGLIQYREGRLTQSAFPSPENRTLETKVYCTKKETGY